MINLFENSLKGVKSYNSVIEAQRKILLKVQFAFSNILEDFLNYYIANGEFL